MPSERERANRTKMIRSLGPNDQYPILSIPDEKDLSRRSTTHHAPGMALLSLKHDHILGEMSFYRKDDDYKDV